MSILLSRLTPAGASEDARRIVLARGLRGFADGMLSVLLASYLSDLGFSPAQIGILITATLLGSAAPTLAVGLRGGRLSPRLILLGACVLMLLTGIGFASITAYWPLLLVAICGTLNPSSGDVSVFIPTEQAVLPRTIAAAERTALFARYSLFGTFAGAFGALASGIPVVLARGQDWDLLLAQRLAFLVYPLVAVAAALLYRGLSAELDPGPRTGQATLATSKRFVLRLAAVFSLDSFGSGLSVQALVALWLFQRYGLSVETAGAIFFVAGVLSAASQLASPWLANRIGLIRTMAYTHVPANVFMILAALMPNVELATTFLLMRMALSQMDIPARQSYVMAMVPPEERAAAASVTNIPRSLMAAISPALGGLLLTQTSFGWPLIIAGAIKIAYDLLLLMFRNLRPEEETAAGVG